MTVRQRQRRGNRSPFGSGERHDEEPGKPKRPRLYHLKMRIGIALLSRSLQQKLTARSVAEASEATRITEQMNHLGQAAREIGKVTSGSFSPALNAGIALGYVDVAEAAIGNGVLVEIRGNKHPGQIVKTPFVPSHVKD